MFTVEFVEDIINLLEMTRKSAQNEWARLENCAAYKNMPELERSHILHMQKIEEETNQKAKITIKILQNYIERVNHAKSLPEKPHTTEQEARSLLDLTNATETLKGAFGRAPKLYQDLELTVELYNIIGLLSIMQNEIQKKFEKEKEND